MKQFFKIICFMFLVFNLFASPFFLWSIIEKGEVIIYKSDYKKRKIKVDSIVVVKRHGHSTRDLKRFYFDGKLLITLQNQHRNNLFKNDIKSKKIQFGQKYMEEHNDSVMLWFHPKAMNQIALPNETVVNTKGYLAHVIIKIFLVLVACCTIVWLILKRKKKKNEEH